MGDHPAALVAWRIQAGLTAVRKGKVEHAADSSRLPGPLARDELTRQRGSRGGRVSARIPTHGAAGPERIRQQGSIRRQGHLLGSLPKVRLPNARSRVKRRIDRSQRGRKPSDEWAQPCKPTHARESRQERGP